MRKRSDCILIAACCQNKRGNGKKVKKTFFLGFSFRDGQDLWLNSYFAFMSKITPDYEV